MRIISRFHDYYDSAMSEGQDRSLVFLRDTDPAATLGLELERKLAELLPRPHYTSVSLRGSGSKRLQWVEEVAESFIVLLGGRLFPGVRCYRGRRELGPTEGFALAYDVAEAEREFAQRGLEWEKRSVLSKQKPSERYAAFFSLAGDARFMDAAVSDRLALCLVIRPTYSAQLRIVRNPQLRDWAFYRVLDAWQTYQELSMFIGGVLAPESRHSSVISDADRLVQRGFDKCSFRHRTSE